MIVVLNGPLGIGKSTTAWALTEQFGRAVMLDMDYIAAIHPFDHYRQSDLEYAYETLALLVRHHHERGGYRQFVVNWVLESPAQLARLKEWLAPVGLAVRYVRFTCAPETLAARIRARGHANLEWELARGQELHGILERAAAQGDMGMVVDTTTLTPEEVAATVRAQVGAPL